jgi:surface-anchored protein
LIAAKTLLVRRNDFSLMNRLFLIATFLASCAFRMTAAELPARILRGHVDLQTVWTPDVSSGFGSLSLALNEEEAGVVHSPSNAVVVVAEAARLSIPDGFEVFGPVGGDLWVLPQSPDPNLPYLGFSAEDLPRDYFGDRMEIRLLSVVGPGSFFLWQSDGFGGIQMAMNSRDGIGASDRVQPLVGGHDHYNFGFTANGVHEVSFEVRGIHSASGTNVVSLPQRIRFEVLPLPPSPWADWIRDTFPEDPDRWLDLPQGDADSDGASNLEEFLAGTDPRSASASARLAVSNGDNGAVELRFPVMATRTAAVTATLESAPSPAGPWLSEPRFALNPTSTALWMRETLSAAPTARFYRLRLQLL